MDDNGEVDHHVAHVVLNQNLHARESLYRSRSPRTRLLLGPRYALLRREFWGQGGSERDIPPIAGKLLVTLGGADPDAVNLKVVAALDDLRVARLEAAIVTGVAGPHGAALFEAAAACRTPTRLYSNVTDMSALMSWADLAVAAGGSTTWERALLGLPSIILVLADNQRELAQSAQDAGIGWNLGWHEQLTPAIIRDAIGRLVHSATDRAAMARQSRSLVDGQGAKRVAQVMSNRMIHLRPARPDDARLLWEWANDSSVRGSSFNPEPIPLEAHLEWFTRRLATPTCRIFIAETHPATPVGQVRFEVGAAGEATISISIGAQFRGTGLASPLIERGVEVVFAESWAAVVHAYIKPDNTASIRAFERAGFCFVDKVLQRGCDAVHLVTRRADR
jgi:spore coat polysaccharide biosynthesis predicted glycosyltransferase SpsG/RimJ/RimL family protein N-acetyltransferase